MSAPMYFMGWNIILILLGLLGVILGIAVLFGFFSIVFSLRRIARTQASLLQVHNEIVVSLRALVNRRA